MLWGTGLGASPTAVRQKRLPGGVSRAQGKFPEDVAQDNFFQKGLPSYFSKTPSQERFPKGAPQGGFPRLPTQGGSPRHGPAGDGLADPMNEHVLKTYVFPVPGESPPRPHAQSYQATCPSRTAQTPCASFALGVLISSVQKVWCHWGRFGAIWPLFPGRAPGPSGPRELPAKLPGSSRLSSRGAPAKGLVAVGSNRPRALGRALGPSGPRELPAKLPGSSRLSSRGAPG